MGRILIFAFAIVVIGCATPDAKKAVVFNVSVDSLAKPITKPKRNYYLVPGNEEVNETDLQFIEFSEYMDRSLRSQGYTKVKRVNDAEIIIVLGYGISDAKAEKFSIPLPIWGSTGVTSSQTTGSVTAIGNTATGQSNTVYNRSYGITGLTMYQGSRDVYTRWAIVSAFDAFNLSPKPSPLWETKIVSSGSSNDLRKVFPYMVAASSPYMGKKSDGKQLISLEEGSPEAMAIQTGIRHANADK